MSDTEQLILNSTEDMIRQGGYNGFSFRNIADSIGIKSSSVHYHFETKEKLGAATTKRYTENFMTALGDPQQLKEDGINPVFYYITAFRNAIISDKGMCLCGILGTETSMLPDSIVAELKNFFEKNIEWLESAYNQIGYAEDSLKSRALQTLSLLEGAMVISTTTKDLNSFDLATTQLVTEVNKQN